MDKRGGARFYEGLDFLGLGYVWEGDVERRKLLRGGADIGEVAMEEDGMEDSCEYVNNVQRRLG